MRIFLTPHDIDGFFLRKTSSKELYKYIQDLFKESTSNALKFEKLKLFIYQNKCDWGQSDLEYFAHKANYKSGWAFHKVAEVEDFLKNPSQGIKVEIPKEILHDSQYEELKPTTIIKVGKYKGKQYCEIQELDKDYAEWFKNNAWLEQRKLRVQPNHKIKEVVKKEYKPEKATIPELTIEEKLVFQIFPLIQKHSMFKVGNPHIDNYCKKYNINNLLEILESLMRKRLIVRIGTITYDTVENYYNKPVERYRSYYDLLEETNTQNKAKLALHQK